MHLTHPLIATLKTAGTMSEAVARTITASYYGPLGLREAGMIANALVEDHTGHSNQNDRFAANDRWPASVDAARAARDRMAMRTKIADMILRFPDAYRDQLYASLAAGRGAEEARALQNTADRRLAVLLGIVREQSAAVVAAG